MTASMAVCFRLSLANPQAHVMRVQCEVARPDPAGQCFVMPAWTPGSYLIREHARNIISLRASCGDHPLAVEKIDKHSWRCAPCSGPLTLEYELYAFDESVRAAYLDSERAFFDGAGVFLRAVGAEALPHRLELTDMPADWQVATTLESAGAGTYEAADHSTLIDHPVLLGALQRIPFAVAGVPHELVLDGAPAVDTARLAKDLAAICGVQQQLMGDPLPFGRYQFLTRVTPRGYGGLEHRSSCALICTRGDLPVSGQQPPAAPYRAFLGLCSHEYFHLWNVKRIRPQAFSESDLSKEAYTRDLWAYEGVTSYYDDLALLRAGIVAPAEYLDLLAQAATRLRRTPGRQRQSLADSSFDAWIKFYRADENTPNSQISYYNKGALVALCLDLHLRLNTLDSCTLDDVLRALWRRHSAVAVPEGGLEALAAECSGLDLRSFFDAYLRGTVELPLQDLLAAFGIEASLRTALSEQDAGGRATGGSALRADLGLRTSIQGGRLLVMHVLDGSASQRAGVHPGDELLALNQLRIEPQEWGARMANLNPGEAVELAVFRRDQLRRFMLTPAARQADTWTFTLIPDPSPDVLSRRQAWLGA